MFFFYSGALEVKAMLPPSATPECIPWFITTLRKYPPQHPDAYQKFRERKQGFLRRFFLLHSGVEIHGFVFWLATFHSFILAQKE
jgi:hypothetical protein